jgi:hypothetical protein
MWTLIVCLIMGFTINALDDAGAPLWILFIVACVIAAMLP